MVAHEILHLACEHHLRRKDRDPVLWNKACDLAIAALLVEAGFTLPKGHPFEASQAGKPTEAIYAAITGESDERGGDGSDKKAKTSAAPAETAPSGGDGDTPFAGAPTDPKAAPAGADLSGATRQRQSASGDKDGDGRIGDKSSHSVGEVRDHPDLDGARQEPKRRELTEKLRQDVSQSRRAAAAMGNMPSGLERMLAGLARPKLDWATLLRRFILDRAVSDYSWSPPNRRHIHMGLYLPSPRSMALGDVVLAIDTSGSVDAAICARNCFTTCGSKAMKRPWPCPTCASTPPSPSRTRPG